MILTLLKFHLHNKYLLHNIQLHASLNLLNKYSVLSY
uniref:Uncharacterized protein n=1 Tax=virus sp. ctrcb4 TaxID=2825824 RepID=A0A8S5RNZ3_9VIRU|nr:MAG TPA: hypothetical protein [virus sp. ctrcb4]DAH01200.1 MAG TPA: hypothetical protein [Crassvirales sp.]